MSKNNKRNIINQFRAKNFLDKGERIMRMRLLWENSNSRKVVERDRVEKFLGPRRVPGEFPKLSSWVPVESTIRLIMLSAHLSTQPFIIPPPVYQYIDPLLTCVKLEPVAAATYLGTRWYVVLARAFVYDGRKALSHIGGTEERHETRPIGTWSSCRSCERYRGTIYE